MSSFWSDVLKIGGVVAAPFTGGMSLIATGLGMSMEQAEEQAKAQERAGDILGAAETRRLALEEEKFAYAKELIAEGKPMREALQAAGLEALPGLTEYATGTPGTGEYYKRSFEQGTKSIFQNLAPYGLTDSSVSGEAVGEFGADLLSQDMLRRLSVGQSLVGGQPNMTGAGVNLFGQTGGMGYAGKQADIAGQSPKAGMFGDIGSAAMTLGSIPLLKKFGLFGGGDQTRTT